MNSFVYEVATLVPLKMCEYCNEKPEHVMIAYHPAGGHYYSIHMCVGCWQVRRSHSPEEALNCTYPADNK